MMDNNINRQVVWSVSICSPPYKSFTYQEPHYFPFWTWKPGLRVLVPMGRANRLCVGVLESSVCCGYLEELKSIHWPLEKEAMLSSEYLKMIKDLSIRQATDPGRILANVLPASFRRIPDALVTEASGKKVVLPGYARDDSGLKKLAQLWIKGEVSFAGKKGPSRKTVSVTQDPPWSILPNARLQWKIMDSLWEQGPMSVLRLRQLLGPGVPGSLKSLAEKGLISIFDDEDSDVEKSFAAEPLDFNLTEDQKKALSFFLPRLEKREFDVNVLHGITGSGKSIVYMHLALKCLEMGRSAVILAPEIAIAAQLHALACRIIKGFKVLLHHGLKSPASREALFSKLCRSDFPVLLVGTRSAVFMPVSNVGLIVIDEEHDESFKQDQNFFYQAKEIAHYLSRRDKSLLILGSATPDIKTFHAARERRVNLVSMTNRVGKSVLPVVQFVDLKQNKPGFGPLSGICEAALKQTLMKGEQAVIMHNRRGYSPIVMCSDCSETAKCKNCQVSLTYHKKRQRLVCHYCGQSLPFSIVCSNCRGSEFVPLGEGTEKVEDFFQKNLDGVEVLRLDRDSTRSPAKAEEILAAFSNKKAQVLVGTQMLSKGHTFPDVTLGIVLDGDLGLGLPDYRASERIFQLLVQLSGRAGRGDKPGRVFIQTRNPDHYCWSYVADCDYQGFFSQEIKRRKLFGYPPFMKLGLIRLSLPSSWNEKSKFISSVKEIVKGMSADHDVKIMGPAPSPLSKLKNRDRYQLLIKAQDWARIRGFYCAFSSSLAPGKNVRVALDLDPLSML